MARHNRESGRMTDPAASAVLAAFDGPGRRLAFRGLLSRRGSRRGANSHPNQTAAYASSQAVAINPRAARVTLLVDDA